MNRHLTITILLFSILLYVLEISNSNILASEVSYIKEIATNKNITYRQAVKKIEHYFVKINDPKKIKSIIKEASAYASSKYSFETKSEYERYDESRLIGICRLINIGTDESIKTLVDLTTHYMGASSGETLNQRITEVGKPAIKYLKHKIQEIENLKIDEKEESQRIYYSGKIERLQKMIKYINKNEIFDVGNSPCRKN